MKILSTVNAKGNSNQTIECNTGATKLVYAFVHRLHPDPDFQFDEYLQEYYSQYKKKYDLVQEWTIYDKFKDNLIRFWLFIKKNKYIIKKDSNHVGFTIIHPEDSWLKEIYEIENE